MTSEDDRRSRRLAQQRAYYETNRERILDRQYEYRQANREVIAERERAYREENRDYVNARGRLLAAKAQAATQKLATVHGPFTPDEDAVVMNPALSIEHTAYILKRTYGSVRGRRSRLLKRDNG